jgi:hypothetical protein
VGCGRVKKEDGLGKSKRAKNKIYKNKIDILRDL